jgi:hypothetical protein
MSAFWGRIMKMRVTGNEMSFKYFRGEGSAPDHVLNIEVQNKEWLITLQIAESQKKIICHSTEELLEKIRFLINLNVPFSSGGMIPGASDQLDLLISNKSIQDVDEYVRLAWLSPNQWEVRRIKEGVLCWEQSNSLSEVVSEASLLKWATL